MHTAVLYISPTQDRADTPIIDSLTRMMVWAIQNKTGIGVVHMNWEESFAINGLSTKGTHTCTCRGASSKPYDVRLPGYVVTNTLAAHNLAYHRSEVPQKVIDFLQEKAAWYLWQEVDVTEQHLACAGLV